MLRASALLALICLLMPGSADARSRRKKQPAAAAPFAYYLFSLSYAPDFCAQPNGDKDPRECGTGRKIGFVVHGLWPQGETDRGPQHCGPASPVSQGLVRTMLPYMPTESLIQHEWETHGTCSGLSPSAYFAAVRKAYNSVKLPSDLQQPMQLLQFSPAQLQSKLAAANPNFPAQAFRVSCYRSGELQEVRVCLNKDLSGRACTGSVGQCSTGSVTLRPVR